MPSAVGCQQIAEFLTPERPAGLDLHELSRRMRDPAYSEAQGDFETATHARESKTLVSMKRTIIDDAKTLQASFSRLVKLQHKKGFNVPTTPEVENLQRALAEFIEKYRLRPRGRPKSRDDDGYLLELAQFCQAALIAVGWRKNASFHSDKGPVTFVVAKCMMAVHNEKITPAAIGRRLREYIKKRN